MPSGLKRFLRHRQAAFVSTLLCCVLFFAVLINARDQIVFIFMPGTQVGTVAPADNVLICKTCHNSSDSSRPVSIYKDWAGSMMAHSARDPIFYAALAVANKYNSVAGQAFGEYCIRCHSPTGWLAGHSEDFTGQSLVGSDFDGVQCDYCHRVVNPLQPDTTVPPLIFPVPGYGNAMHVMQRTSTPKRGTLDSVAAPHSTRYDAFQSKSEMCGVCHDVSNPFYAIDPTNQAPHEYLPIERTYSEWLMSEYATMGDSGTCQSCHMKASPGYASVYFRPGPRPAVHKHDLTGGNTFVPDILPDFWSGLDTAALAQGKLRAVATLQSAASMSVVAYPLGDSVIARVTVTNLTGHKLPTGYPDGRRMWISLVGRDAGGSVVFQSGFYDPDSAILERDAQLKIYEAKRGLTEARAASYGLPPGESFHFVLNDTFMFDNRIPPKGFTNAGFAQRLASPIGVFYPDSQYWDVTRYVLPATVKEVTATLYYQTISREYIEFLRDENSGNLEDWNQWGDKLFAAWQGRGKSVPVTMNSRTVNVSTTRVEDNLQLPLTVRLLQNYPNPFNPTTTISFTLDRASFVTLKVYDLQGKVVARLVNDMKQSGTHDIPFNASTLSSGLYIYELQLGTQRLARKMLVVQ